MTDAGRWIVTGASLVLLAIIFGHFLYYRLDCFRTMRARGEVRRIQRRQLDDAEYRRQFNAMLAEQRDEND